MKKGVDEQQREKNKPSWQMVSSIVDVFPTLDEEVDDETRSDEERQRVDELVDHRVCDVRVPRPDVSLRKDAPKVGPPRVPRPPKDLQDEPPVRLHRREELGLLADLDVRVPAVGDHPPGKKLVVARVEVVLAEPEVVREAVEKVGVLEDDRPVGGRSSRETRDAAVDVSRRCDLDVADGKTEGGEDFPDGHLVPDGLDPLRRSHAADFLILEAGEDGREEGGRPDCVVVGEENDVGRRVPDAVTHLEPLVGERYGEHSDPRRVHGVGEVLKRAEHALFGDDDDFFGLADEPGVGGFFELLAGVNGGNDDGDVFRGDVGGVLGHGNWTVGEGGGESDPVPKISVEPEQVREQRRWYPISISRIW
jgi:hypothetical protein